MHATLDPTKMNTMLTHIMSQAIASLVWSMLPLSGHVPNGAPPELSVELVGL